MDVRSPGGGGGDKFEPQTIEQAQEILTPQIAAASEAVARLPQALRAPNRIYLEAKMLPNYLAASYFPSELLAQVGGTPVGSRADVGQYVTKTKSTTVRTRRLVFTVSDLGLDQLRRLVTEGGRNRSEDQAFAQIRELEELSLPRQSDVLRSSVLAREDGEPQEAQPTWEAVLHPGGATLGEPFDLDDESLERWFHLILENGGQAHRDFVRRVGGLTFAPVSIAIARSPALARFNPLRVLRPMPAIRPRPRFGTRSGQALTPPSTHEPVSGAISVAVFDGGVDVKRRSSGLFDITTHELTPEAAAQGELDHGTGVTGAVLYGLVGPGDQAPRPPLPTVSYRVLPAPPIPGDLDGYWVLDRIKEAVEEKGHRLVNLSLGPTLAVEDDMEPNRWTSELDQLAWEKDVLFVIAAGNDGEEDQEAGLHRIQVPADMANGLAVGACDAAAPSAPWARAPYSSMGPGRHGARVQPLGVQFGGAQSNMFNVLRSDGSFLEASGTSFAAPLTTNALADLSTRLPRVNSSVLRAFATHFAERPTRHRKLQVEVGYGRQPLDYAQALDCPQNEARILYADNIERGDLLGYRLPVPSQTQGALSVILTLAYVSPVDPTQPTEYTNASLELVMRPHHQLHTFTAPKGVKTQTRRVDLRSAEARTLLSEGWKHSQEPTTKTLSSGRGTSEIELREAGKWETVRHYRLTLKPGEVELPRLELSYIARRGGSLDHSPTRIPFAMLVSVVDDSATADTYNEVRSQYAALRPVSRARGRLRTRASAEVSNWY